MSDDLLERLSAKLHEIYQIEVRHQDDVCHHDEYAQLTDSTKEYDRVLARLILKHVGHEHVCSMLDDPLTAEV